MNVSIQKHEDRLIFVLPNEITSKLGWDHGDVLFCEVVDGGVKIVRSMTKHEHAMKIAREGMQKYGEALNSLAKS
jgi:hypothetical protein